MIRKPAVAGQFYPGSKETLRKAVREYLSVDAKPKQVMGLAAPHAGYIYSGPTAGKTYARAAIPKKCIVLAPSHTGVGAKAAIMLEGAWETPLGNIPIDMELAKSLLDNCSLLTEDSLAHVSEHSLEVQLPFLQMLQPELLFVPICLQHIAFESCLAMGKAVAKTIMESGDEILIVASTDMNHFENQETTLKKDALAIEKVTALDPEGLLKVCSKEAITMCGVIPTAVMLVACKELGATKAELVNHSTSGDILGDYDSVVGYAGFIVY